MLHIPCHRKLFDGISDHRCREIWYPQGAPGGVSPPLSKEFRSDMDQPPARHHSNKRSKKAPHPPRTTREPRAEQVQGGSVLSGELGEILLRFGNLPVSTRKAAAPLMERILDRLAQEGRLPKESLQTLREGLRMKLKGVSLKKDD